MRAYGATDYRQSAEQAVTRKTGNDCDKALRRGRSRFREPVPHVLSTQPMVIALSYLTETTLAATLFLLRAQSPEPYSPCHPLRKGC